MKTVCVMESVSRANGGIFEAELALQKTLNAKFDVGVKVLGLEDAHTQADLKRWLPVVPVVAPVQGPRAVGYSPELRGALWDADADLGYLAGLWKYPACLIQRWAESTRRPLVVAPHGMLDPWARENSRWKKWLALRVFQDRQLRTAACIRALCEAEAHAIRGLGIKSPIAIVANGVNLPRLEAASRRPSFFPPERRVLFYLGRLHPKKGLIALLRAWKDVRARYPEWLLVIAGWDQEGHAVELQRAAAKLDLAWANGAVKLSPGVALCLPGPQFGPAKDDCLRNCDALVLPSQSEGLPMVILEAWSFAKPVLMTPACNLPQGADAGAAVVADPTQKSLALELLQILESSPEQLKEMGRRGRALVEDRYQWPKIASQMVGVYEWVLGSGNAPGCVGVLKN